MAKQAGVVDGDAGQYSEGQWQARTNYPSVPVSARVTRVRVPARLFQSVAPASPAGRKGAYSISTRRTARAWPRKGRP